MPESGYRTKVLKEFDPDHAGQYVGWVNVNEIAESGFIVVNLAYARIAPNGAICSYFERDGVQLPHSAQAQGFEHSTELTVSGIDDTNMNTTVSRAPRINQQRGNSTIVESGFASSFYTEDGNPSEDGHWTIGEDKDILEGLQDKLSEHGVGWMYKYFYYNLAQMADKEMILGDPAMQEHTDTIEIQSVGEYKELLEKARLEDGGMLHSLKRLGDQVKASYPSSFRTSRRIIGEYESEAGKRRQQAVVGKWLMLIRDVRTWPYMDPTNHDSWAAFGVELRDLRAGNSKRAKNELEAEIGALTKRINTAAGVLGRLSLQQARELELSA
jgi:hypothetical protein